MEEESRVVWSRKASQCLEHIFLYIAEDSEVYAKRFVKSLILYTEEFFRKPPVTDGRIVPEFEGTRLTFLREIIYRGYRIIYDSTADDGKVRIVVIIHGRQSLERNL